MQHPKMNIVMHNGNTICVELYPEYANNAVNSLIEMVEMHAYDNMEIQRIVPNFVLQPWYDETRMSDAFQYLIEAECANNGYDNPLRFEKYVVGMAGDGEKYASNSAFFICLGNEEVKRLQGKFAAIGKVIDGFKEIDRLSHVELRKVEVEENVQVFEPIHAEIIQTIHLELNGYKSSQPIKLKEEELLCVQE